MSVQEGLRLEGIHSYYDESHVLHGIDLEVAPGELVFLLGRNGAGKSTTMLSATNLVKPRQGQVLLHGEELNRIPPHEIVTRGLALVPEDRRLFPNMTVMENLMVASSHARPSESPWTVEQVLALFPVVEKFIDRKALTLSGGEQQMVAIARALMSNPRILLLDEPMEGLAPLVIEAIEGQLAELAEHGVGLLVSETHLHRVLRMNARAYVIDRGSIVFSGSHEDLVANREQVERHLSV